MAGVPTSFQTLSNVLPTYQFIDIASGTGYITFYAGSTVDDDLLSNFAYYSDAVYTSATGTQSGTAVKVLDLDFDTTLNRPMDLNGLAIVNVPIGTLGSGGAETRTFARVTLRKYSGSTETDIVSNDSAEYNPPNNSQCYEMLSVDLTVPLTHYKKGDILRLTIELWSYSSNGSDWAYTQLAHDPKGRTTGWDSSGAVPSTLLFYCPVRLNL